MRQEEIYPILDRKNRAFFSQKSPGKTQRFIALHQTGNRPKGQSQCAFQYTCSYWSIWSLSKSKTHSQCRIQSTDLRVSPLPINVLTTQTTDCKKYHLWVLTTFPIFLCKKAKAATKESLQATNNQQCTKKKFYLRDL